MINEWIRVVFPQREVRKLYLFVAMSPVDKFCEERFSNVVTKIGLSSQNFGNLRNCHCKACCFILSKEAPYISPELHLDRFLSLSRKKVKKFWGKTVQKIKSVADEVKCKRTRLMQSLMSVYVVYRT